MHPALKAISLLFLIVSLQSCSFGQGTLLLSETFDFSDGPLPSRWWCEGDVACIKDGRLFVDSDSSLKKASTIWLEKEFSGNLSVEFDVHVVSSSESKNNINFFLLYSSPEGRPLRETESERMDGKYPNYHKLNGYIFTHLADGNEDTARFRFRYNPGFSLLDEVYTYECRKGITYHVKIIKQDETFQYWTDDRLIFENKVDDLHLIEKGILGFRTWHTCLWWDNLKIKQL